MNIVETSDISQEVHGGVIESITIGVEGLHIMLADGRFLVIPDAEMIAVCNSERVRVH